MKILLIIVLSCMLFLCGCMTSNAPQFGYAVHIPKGTEILVVREDVNTGELYNIKFKDGFISSSPPTEPAGDWWILQMDYNGQICPFAEPRFYYDKSTTLYENLIIMPVERGAKK